MSTTKGKRGKLILSKKLATQSATNDHKEQVVSI
jgi:hypothetical protein